jgi:ribosomal protein S18 acetylase RimI-like enzyme
MSGTGPADVLVRRIRADDWPALRALRLRALATDPMAFGSTLAREQSFEEALWRERASRDATSATSSQWVAEEPSGRFVGSAVVAEMDGALHVFGMWVDPARRGEGLGGRLLDAGLAWAGQALPGGAVVLHVNPSQEVAVRLYLSRGFRKTGKSEPLGHTDGVFIVEMVREPS